MNGSFSPTGGSWNNGSPGVRIAQGFLSLDPERNVRVRLAGNEAWLTIKGRAVGVTRAEFEYPIPTQDVRDLLDVCLPSVIDKTRHRIRFSGNLWEVDVFHGANEGLVMAEVELEDESKQPELPPWVGEEVSLDTRYCNASLAVTPCSMLQGQERAVGRKEERERQPISCPGGPRKLEAWMAGIPHTKSPSEKRLFMSARAMRPAGFGRLNGFPGLCPSPRLHSSGLTSGVPSRRSDCFFSHAVSILGTRS